MPALGLSLSPTKWFSHFSHSRVVYLAVATSSPPICHLLSNLTEKREYLCPSFFQRRAVASCPLVSVVNLPCGVLPWFHLFPFILHQSPTCKQPHLLTVLEHQSQAQSVHCASQGTCSTPNPRMTHLSVPHLPPFLHSQHRGPWVFKNRHKHTVVL